MKTYVSNCLHECALKCQHVRLTSPVILGQTKLLSQPESYRHLVYVYCSLWRLFSFFPLDVIIFSICLLCFWSPMETWHAPNHWGSLAWYMSTYQCWTWISAHTCRFGPALKNVSLILSYLYFQALAPDDLGGCGLFCYPSSWVKPPLLPPNTHAFKPRRWHTIPTTQYETIWNGSVDLFISKITIMMPVHFSVTPITQPPLPLLTPCLFEESSGPPLSALTCCLLLPGWVAGLRGGAVQHGPHASQQHTKPEKNDVIHGSRAQSQSWEPPNPLAAQPQPPRTPGSSRTGPPQPHGPSFSRQLSTPGKTVKKTWTLLLWKKNLKLSLDRCCGDKQ